MRSCCKWFLPAVAAVTAAAQAPAGRVEALNRQLRQFAGEAVKEAPAAAAPGSLSQAIAERAEAFALLIPSDPKRALELALPEPTLATLRALAPEAAAGLERRGRWSGEAEVAIEDGVGFRSSRRLVWVRADTPLDAWFAYGEPAELASGGMLTVEGVRLGAHVAVERATAVQAAAVCNPTGEQRIAVILVNFPGATHGVTPSLIHDYFFSASDSSVDGFWRESSYGKTWASGDVFGPFDLDRVYTCDQVAEMRNAAMLAAARVTDLTRYNRIYVLFPRPSSGCTWSGLGTLGCTTLNSAHGVFRASTTWLSTPATMAREYGVFLGVHEGGHNLGLGHAHSRDHGPVALGAPGEPGYYDEYGDQYSAMGNGRVGHYSVEHKLELGWLDPADVAIIEDAGSQRLLPLESQTPGVKALRVRRTAGLDDWLWFEYHQPIGPYVSGWRNNLRAPAFGGTVVHYEDRHVRPGGAHAADTALLDFTPLSTEEAFDFFDAALAGGHIWNDPFSTRTIRVGPAEADGITIEAANEVSCLTLTSVGREHGAGEESGTIEISATPGCTWTASTVQPWIALAPPASGTGPATMQYIVRANTEPDKRTGSIAIERRTFAITQSAVSMEPRVIEQAPISGAGPVVLAGSAFFDPNGTADLATLAINVTARSGIEGACALEYDVATQTVRLVNDAGTGWAGVEPLATAFRLSNSQCAVQFASAGRGRGPEGDNLYLSAALLLKTSAREERKIFAAAWDAAGLSSGWVERGTWTVEPNWPPEPAGISPSDGTGMRQVFAVSVRDANGAADIAQVDVRFTGDRGTCAVTVTPETRRLGLLGDAGVWSFKLFGSAEAIANSACAVDAASVAVYAGGGEIRVRLPMIFKDGFQGRLTVSATAADRTGVWSERRELGTFTVGVSSQAAPEIAAVVNAASFAGGAVAAGEIVTIFGRDLGPALTHSYYEDGWLCQSVGGTEVFFDNLRAPLVYTSAEQISAVVPYGVQATATVRVEFQGRQSNEIQLAVASASPGVFTFAQNGQGQAVAVNQDRSMNWERPAPLGSIVSLFVTGEGRTLLSWPDGKLPVAPSWPTPMYPVSVTFGGREGRIDFAGMVYAGVLQINVQVPDDAPTGPAVPVTVRVAGASSPGGVTVALAGGL